MGSTTAYQVLAQYAADCRRLGLTQTAELIDREHARIIEQFGPPTGVIAPPKDRTVAEMLDRLRLAERRALGADQYGRVDRAGALAAQATTSAVARLLAERGHLLPQDLARVEATVETHVSGSFERIEAQRDAEARLAAFQREQRWQEARRAAVRARERERMIAELEMTKARLETALAQ